VHEGGTLPLARVLDRLAHRIVALEHVAAVDLLDEEARKARDELGDAPAGGVHLDRDGDRVAVVLDEVDDGQFQVAGGVQRLPELALAGGAVAGGAEHHLVLLEPVSQPEQLGPQRALRGADGLEELRARGGGGGDDVELLLPPVGRHLPAAGARVDRGAHGLVEHLVRRHAEHEAERAVPVIEVEPVVGGPERHAGGGEHRFVTRPRDLEEDLVLALELDLPVVEAAREQHVAVCAQQLLAAQSRGGLPLGAGLGGHASPEG
jgi:hypothetical protein